MPRCPARDVHYRVPDSAAAGGRASPSELTHSEGGIMATKSGRSWKQERASVSRRGATRSKSNKYSGGDPPRSKPGPGERSRVWVGGYTRDDGTKVAGHYRATPNAR